MRIWADLRRVFEEEKIFSKPGVSNVSTVGCRAALVRQVRLRSLALRQLNSAKEEALKHLCVCVVGF